MSYDTQTNVIAFAMKRLPLGILFLFFTLQVGCTAIDPDPFAKLGSLVPFGTRADCSGLSRKMAPRLLETVGNFELREGQTVKDRNELRTYVLSFRNDQCDFVFEHRTYSHGLGPVLFRPSETTAPPSANYMYRGYSVGRFASKPRMNAVIEEYAASCEVKLSGNETKQLCFDGFREWLSKNLAVLTFEPPATVNGLDVSLRLMGAKIYWRDIRLK
ncbi:MAG: hypothetical protein AAGA08_18100 [Pseudomonadota bacterium]